MCLGMISPTFFSRSLKGRCYDKLFLARIGKNWHTHLHAVRRHSTTWLHALTTPMIPLHLIKIW